VWREPDASQPGVSREQVRDLGTPRKNSTIRHPDAQIPAETQEAQKKPRRRGQNYQKLQTQIMDYFQNCHHLSGGRGPLGIRKIFYVRRS